MHISELTRRMIAEGLWTTRGKTPEATVASKLYMEIKENGDRSRVILTGPSTFALRGQHTPSAPQSPRIKSPRSQRHMTFTDAAERVLRTVGNGQPMHYRAITQVALDQGWLTSNGRTPEATMYAQILMEIKNRLSRGEQPRFTQLGRGYVGLSEQTDPGLMYQITQHNNRIRKQLLDRLLSVPPAEFEEIIAQLLATMGCTEVEVTRQSGDGGIDIRSVLCTGDAIRTRLAIQVKRWKTGNNIHSNVVQMVRGSLGAHEQGLIITTSDFSQGARDEAMRPDKSPIGLINGVKLVDLMMEHGIGVRRRSLVLFELEEPDTATLDEASLDSSALQNLE